MKNISNAYTEVLVILQNLKGGYYSIPREIIEKMKRECNLNHEFKLQNNIPIQEQKLLDETKAILAIFYRDYWANTEQKKLIEMKEENDIKLSDKQKREKYNPEALFKNTETKFNEENKLVISTHQNIFKKFINYLKRVIKIID